MYAQEAPDYEPEPYVVLSADKTVVTFYYDIYKDTRDGTIMEITGYYQAPWWDYRGSIKSVVFDASFGVYPSLTSTAKWFEGCFNLTTITGIHNLKTYFVKDMSYMFSGCKSLTSIDVSGLNTSNVMNMSNMFNACSGLTSLDVSGFDTSNVMTMLSMFYACSDLTSLDVSNFNTANVRYMEEMFGNCCSLTNLDLSSFNTTKAAEMTKPHV